VSGDERVIRASEVGAYAYCAHAWWLGHIEGLRPEHGERLRAGRAAHERHGVRMLVSMALIRLGYLLLALTGLAGLTWIVSALLS